MTMYHVIDEWDILKYNTVGTQQFSYRFASSFVVGCDELPLGLFPLYKTL
jgi:hypothetical protein